MAYGTVNVGSSAKPAGDYLTKDDINQPGGVLGLDENGKIPDDVKEDVGLTGGGEAKYHAVTLTAAGWSNKNQTVSVPGILADETKQLITAVAKSTDKQVFEECQLRMTTQAENAVTFGCSTAPDNDLTVYIVVQEVVAV